MPVELKTQNYGDSENFWKLEGSSVGRYQASGGDLNTSNNRWLIDTLARNVAKHMGRIEDTVLLIGNPSVFKNEAIENYLTARTNGDEQDNPTKPFPEDGTYSWVEFESRTFRLRYTEGQKDAKWMAEKDRNYVIRMEAAEHAEMLKNTFNLEIQSREAIIEEPSIFPVKEYDEDIPDLYLCPITGRFMAEPVKTTADQVYEKEAIETWLMHHNTDPKTNVNLADRNLTPIDGPTKQFFSSYIDEHPALKHSNGIYLPKQLFFDLVAAMESKNEAAFREVIQKDKRVLAKKFTVDRSAFHLVCELGTVGMLEYMLNQLTEAELNSILAIPKPDNWQPQILNEALLNAARTGNVEAINRYLHFGANINVQDREGRTALILGSINGHKDAIETLLENGADFSIRDLRGEAPLDHAITFGHFAIVEHLLEKGLPATNNTTKLNNYIALKMQHDNAKALHSLIHGLALRLDSLEKRPRHDDGVPEEKKQPDAAKIPENKPEENKPAEEKAALPFAIARARFEHRENAPPRAPR